MIQKTTLVCILFLFCSSSSVGEVKHLNYKATFGFFGTVGTIKNKLIIDANTYSIDTTVKLEGIAKLLLGGQEEHYVSKGHMQKGLMISDFYEMTTTKGVKKKVKTYTINHKQKYVTKRYRKWKHEKLIKDTTKRLSFYAKDDLQTLYFNLGTALKEKGKTYTFNVVGLEKQKGKVHITVPLKIKSSSYLKELGGSATIYAKALIHQKNFRKKKGDILLAISKDGFIEKSVIKDILFYGDAVLTRTK